MLGVMIILSHNDLNASEDNIMKQFLGSIQKFMEPTQVFSIPGQILWCADLII